MPTRDEAWPQGTPCWVDVQVDDLEAARAFYSGLFGWDIQDSSEDAGGYLMASLKGKSVAGLGPKPEGMPVPSAWTTYLAADSADEVAAKITAAGGQNFMPPFDVMDAGRMFVATDSTGAAFGVWEAKTHTGAGIFNEPGAYVWNELHTRNYAAAKKFYTEVFGYSYNEVGDGEHMIYSTFALPGAAGPEDNVGGFGDDSKQPGEGAYWLTWFASDDTEATIAKAQELGATVMMPAEETPFGHMGIVAGPQGEVFGVINVGRTQAPAAQ
ncbi:hypothetical protein FHU41_000120 [Psychromicrobium silvestre]|uniref:VOC domain-containing protein n=1 Tax=Psychromicrobium silvestre TaxID=1645614 RepID=A0A7Y9LQU5_9MICC|nr:VOC family protein [Psychromicrobium silvestre]NYE93899.1 hypothetical protein [Psychromicrobium silvestre]